jgi:hypothetical protein
MCCENGGQGTLTFMQSMGRRNQIRWEKKEAKACSRSEDTEQQRRFGERDVDRSGRDGRGVDTQVLCRRLE